VLKVGDRLLATELDARPVHRFLARDFDAGDHRVTDAAGREPGGEIRLASGNRVTLVA
jgi:hypothetical protein